MNDIAKLIRVLLHGPKTTGALEYVEGIADALEIAKRNPSIFNIHHTSFSTPLISLKYMDKSQQIQNGKGSRPRPVKGDIFRERFDEIFGKKEKPIKKEKQEKTQCPHCATFNLIQESRWLSRCLKCGWTG